MKAVFALIFCTFLVAPINGFSQSSKSKDGTQLRGIIVGADNQQPLAYASVGLLNKPIGTIADSAGYFELTVDSENMDDTLQVSMVGYWPIKRPVKEFTKTGGQIVISLSKKVMQLSEVVVSNQFAHTVIVGRQSGGRFIQASLIPKGGRPPTIGAESGLKIQAPKYPALLDNFNFYLSGNNFRYIKFRVNFYSLKHNLPDTLLFNKEILVTLDSYKTGWTHVDLTAYDLVIRGDCAVTLQWVDYNKDMTKSLELLIPTGVSFSRINYFRAASQDKWNSVKGTPGIFIMLRD